MKNEQIVRTVVKETDSRESFWNRFISDQSFSNMAEIGVYKGDLSAEILRQCPAVSTYYMIDPWRHLEDWNKPANKQVDTFEQYYEETLQKTDFARERRVVLRGTTSEVIEEIPDGSLDFVYIDGDHTLRGITIDLMKIYPKIRDGGWIGGDDLSPNIWQHAMDFEPTFVFPYTVYFAEAVSDTMYALPYQQFLIHKSNAQNHSFIDLTGQYADTTVRNQLTDLRLKERVKAGVKPHYKALKKLFR